MCFQSRLNCPNIERKTIVRTVSAASFADFVTFGDENFPNFAMFSDGVSNLQNATLNVVANKTPFFAKLPRSS